MFYFSFSSIDRPKYGNRDFAKFWIDVPFIEENIPKTEIWSSGHRLHSVGAFLKDQVLRSSIILQTSDELEAASIMLLWESFVLDNGPGSVKLMEAWRSLDMELIEEIMFDDSLVPNVRVRSNQLTIDLLKKIAVRVEDSMIDVAYILSQDFKDQTKAFTDHLQTEIERIDSVNRRSKTEVRKARNQITKELSSKSFYKSSK